MRRRMVRRYGRPKRIKSRRTSSYKKRGYRIKRYGSSRGGIRL